MQESCATDLLHVTDVGALDNRENKPPVIIAKGEERRSSQDVADELALVSSRPSTAAEV